MIIPLIGAGVLFGLAILVDIGWKVREWRLQRKYLANMQRLGLLK